MADNKKKVDNEQIVQRIIEEGSDTLKNTFGREVKQVLDKETGKKSSKVTYGVDLKDGAEVFNVLNSYETIKNEFITSLVNKIVKTQFFSKVYNNPLKFLHNGTLPLGSTVEDIFVERSKKYGFGDHFDSNGNSEKDLIGKTLPPVLTLFHSKNYEYKYKVSVSYEQLRTAFKSQEGLSRLCNDLINANLSGAYIDEYNDMKGIIDKLTQGNGTTGDSIKKGFICNLFEKLHADNSNKYVNMLETIRLDTKDNIENALVSLEKKTLDLEFASTKHNISDVTTFSDRNDLIIFMDTTTKAKIKLKYLANVFNLSEGEIKEKIVVVDKFNQFSAKTKNYQPRIILADKNIIQAWDTINTTATFENANGLYTNYFLHKQGIYSYSGFSQFVVFAEALN